MLTLWSVVIWPLQDSAPAVGTEGGQAVRSCRPGQKPQAGVVVSQNAVTVVFGLLVLIVPVLCLLNI